MVTSHRLGSTFAATGRVVPLAGQPVSGATHALVNGKGEAVVLLRSRRITLDVYAGRLARAAGDLRGQVEGEPAPVLEVARMARLPWLDGAEGGYGAGGTVRVELW